MMTGKKWKTRKQEQVTKSRGRQGKQGKLRKVDRVRIGCKLVVCCVPVSSIRIAVIVVVIPVVIVLADSFLTILV